MDYLSAAFDAYAGGTTVLSPINQNNSRMTPNIYQLVYKLIDSVNHSQSCCGINVLVCLKLINNKASRMRQIEKAPSFSELLANGVDFQKLLPATGTPAGRQYIEYANSRYIHWDKHKYLRNSFPPGLTVNESWALVVLSRIGNFKALPLRFESGQMLKYWIPPGHMSYLHTIDQKGGGAIGISSKDGVGKDFQNRYLINSLMEEAIASSQLEGASTTRKAAKQMLRKQRRAKNRAERMILNNYLAIQHIRAHQDVELSVDFLVDLQRILTDKTMGDEEVGRFRVASDRVVVEDSRTHEEIFTPPPACQVQSRLEELCEFANVSSKDFIHPVVKAIILHFTLGFIHPFVDGNGRTARAIFYWYMLKHGYWLFEFLPISRIFLNSPTKYVRAYCYSETDEGDLTYFIDYNLRVIVRAISELHDYLGRKEVERREFKTMILNIPGINVRQAEVLKRALSNSSEVIDIAEHRAEFQISYATARSDLLSLVDMGFLSKTAIKKTNYFTPESDLLNKLKKACSINQPAPMVKAEPTEESELPLFKHFESQNRGIARTTRSKELE